MSRRYKKRGPAPTCDRFAFVVGPFNDSRLPRFSWRFFGRSASDDAVYSLLMEYRTNDERWIVSQSKIGFGTPLYHLYTSFFYKAGSEPDAVMVERPTGDLADALRSMLGPQDIAAITAMKMRIDP